MKSRWALSLLLPICLIFSSPPPAWGKPQSKKPSSVNVEEVKKLAEKGALFFKNGEYQKALSSFQSAYELDPVPGFLFNIGLCYLRMKDPQNAAASFRAFLKKADPDDPLRPRVEEHLAEAEEEMAALGISPAPEKGDAPSPALSAPEEPGEEPSGNVLWPKALYGGAALFLVAGSVTGGVGFASILKGRALEEEGRFSEMAEQFARGRKLGLTADAFLVAGVISGGVGYLLSRRAKKAEASLSLAPHKVVFSVRF